MTTNKEGDAADYGWEVAVLSTEEKKAQITNLYKTTLDCLNDTKGGWPVTMFRIVSTSGDEVGPRQRQHSQLVTRALSHELSPSLPQEQLERVLSLGIESEEEASMQTVKGYLLCKICHQVLRQAMKCPNQHFFCKSCITNHIKLSPRCPSCLHGLEPKKTLTTARTARNIIDELEVSCPNESLGCTASVAIGHLIQHLQGKCCAKMTRCENEGCDMLIYESLVDTHKALCPHETVTCPNPRCVATYKRSCELEHSCCNDFVKSWGKERHLLCQRLADREANLTKRLSAQMFDFLHRMDRVLTLVTSPFEGDGDTEKKKAAPEPAQTVIDITAASYPDEILVDGVEFLNNRGGFKSTQTGPRLAYSEPFSSGCYAWKFKIRENNTSEYGLIYADDVENNALARRSIAGFAHQVLGSRLPDLPKALRSIEVIVNMDTKTLYILDGNTTIAKKEFELRSAGASVRLASSMWLSTELDKEEPHQRIPLATLEKVVCPVDDDDDEEEQAAEDVDNGGIEQLNSEVFGDVSSDILQTVLMGSLPFSPFLTLASEYKGDADASSAPASSTTSANAANTPEEDSCTIS